MKKVLLLGDSIRLGYCRFVKEALDGIVEVYSPKENCAFAQYLYRWLHVWKKNEGYPDDIDLVHWNVGAWDVLRMFGEGTFTSPEFYCETLKKLQKHIQFLFPKAKQIFATGTSVVEEGYGPSYQRYNADIEQFNRIAIETLTPLGVEINDLYSLTKNIDESCRSDMTHFYTINGIKLLGGRVLEVVCQSLDVPLEEAKDADVVIPKLSIEVVGH